jgi:hypothetical protein
MFGGRLIIGSLALCLASSAVAQESLEKGKTGAQLYASNCAVCHKSPQSVTTTSGIFGLENFLRDHYTVSSESAATVAAYLHGLRKPDSTRGRAAKRTNQAKPSTPSETRGDVPRPPADVPRP